MAILDSINNPHDLKNIAQDKLPELADEIRARIINSVSKTGGHLAPSLGVVELTIALHYIFEAPEDAIIWDVGHQSYTHKILTGRKSRIDTLRQMGGISGFPNKYESDYDPFTSGHSSTSISWALGMAAARDLKGETKKVVAVIGDAALAGGMAFEALNYAGESNKGLIVVLNDNKMSISPPIGAMSRYLNRVISAPIYNRVRDKVEELIKKVPKYGLGLSKVAGRLEESLKSLLIPGMLFEELGFRYFGPIDGHSFPELLSTIKNVKDMKEPVLIHVVTKKGKGYQFAEDSPDKFHGIAPFEITTGKKNGKTPDKISFTQAFGEKMIELAGKDPKIIAITAAMPEGTGLDKFAEQFPERFFDVGIAEQHAVGFAAGLAKGGFKPVAAIYSTFLQRAFDQIIHDVCLQGLHVVFAIDRAGVVGEDGPTHHGPFDLAYLSHLPNMTVMAPKDQQELGAMLEFAVNSDGPIAIRYPRGGLLQTYEVCNYKPRRFAEFGKAEVLREGGDACILAVGSMVYPSLEAAEILTTEGIDVKVVNVRFVKPFDKELLREIFEQNDFVTVVEEGVITGGFSALVSEFIESEGFDNVTLKRLGLPDRFMEHGPRKTLLNKAGLNAENIAQTTLSHLRGGTLRPTA